MGGTCTEGKKSPEPEKAVEVMLAEFNAMRAEKVSYLTGQAAIVTLGITALGVVAGFAIKDGHDRLLLVVPPLVMLVVLATPPGRIDRTQSATTFAMSSGGSWRKGLETCRHGNGGLPGSD